jgi:4-amino-4-deoxy-L-arabinose transferase-like glycosyltransferase
MKSLLKNRLSIKPIHKEICILAIILTIALAVRLWGIDFGLPYLYHPDEPNKILIAQRMFKTGDLNPHYFLKPTLFIYLNALAYVPFFLLGKILGIFTQPADIHYPIILMMGVGFAPTPKAVLTGRLLTTIFALANIFMIYLVGKSIKGKSSVGIIAAFLLAISPTNVEHSRYITENTFLVFFILIVTWAAIKIFRFARLQDYILAGLATGFAVSSKYPGIIIAIVPFLAHIINPTAKYFKDYKLYIGFLVIIIGFLITTPYAVLDYPKFLEDTLYEVNHYSTGHPGMEGNSLLWYIEYMWKTSGIIYLIAIAEIFRGIANRSRVTILLTSFVAIYFLFISSFTVRNDRTFLPLTPFLFLLAASFIVDTYRRVSEINNRALYLIGVSAMAGVIIISLIAPISNTIAGAIQLTRIDSRETSRVWIAKNIPPGAKIAIESYSPYVDPSKYTVESFGRMFDNEPDWYVENGFDYLVFSQGIYGRFYLDSERYASEVEKYDNLFNRFILIKKFMDGGYEIRIYKLP